MKKGFTMIELIFVIVILGILASVAIPRLAATREDAEVSAAVANLRTLISDASSYYAAKGTFTDVNWKDITNVPLQTKPKTPIGATTTATTTVNIGVGADGKDCISVQLVNRNPTDAPGAPAHIKITAVEGSKGSGVCKTVVESAPIKAYTGSKVSYTNNEKKSASIDSAVAIGSSTSVY